MINKILILDDNKDLTEALKIALTDAGYPKVVVANNVKDAKLFLDKDVNLALIDVVLYRDPSNQNGEEFAQWVKQVNKNCWVVLMTAHDDLISTLRASDVDGVLLKTGHFQDLVDEINKINTLSMSNKDDSYVQDIRMLKIETARLREEAKEDRQKVGNLNIKLSKLEATVTTISKDVSDFITKHQGDALKIILAFAAIIISVFAISTTITLYAFNHFLEIIQKLPH